MVHPKISLIVTYFGKLPAYINYFLLSCAYNKNIDFLIFTDNPVEPPLPSNNIKFFKFDLQAFNKMASEKLNQNIKIPYSYKLCDYKPMYGAIYEDYLIDYEFWGHCDVDMIFGDTSKILTSELLNNYDIISGHPLYISGPFTLFRNIKEVNWLFAKSRDLDNILHNPKTLYFDEAGSVIRKLWEGHGIFDFESETESMTHLVKNRDKFKLRVLFSEFLVEGVYNGVNYLVWNKGVLMGGHKKEIFLFHYLIYKSGIFFNIPPLRQLQKFTFNQNGFFTNDIRNYTTDWIYWSIHNFSVKAKRKLKRIYSGK